jgi:hypothetical protein
MTLAPHCSYLSQYDVVERNDRCRRHLSIESREVDRGFELQTGSFAGVFSCGEADEGALWVGLGKRGRLRMMRPSD